MSIRIDNICKNYENNKVVLSNINLEIKDHEFICILGPSGCGKSTLLNIIAGLDTATAGSVFVNDKPVTGPSNDRVMMFQGQSLFPWLTVTENIMFGLKLKKLTQKEQEEIASKYLKLVKLEEFKDYNIHKLSGGMQQRVSLARALAIESKFILMDEPFSSLEKQTINILREELEGLWSKLKSTIIYVTHSVEEAIFFADRIVMLSANPGTVKKVFEVTFPRPRRVDDEEAVHLRAMILKELRYEVELSEENRKII
ncbi:MAG: transporter related protein [Clostridia bacterium]|nr:transporter related protein [Clostridia bacterium]